MRALLSTLKKGLAAAPRRSPSAARSLIRSSSSSSSSSSSHHHDDLSGKRKKPYILGPDLPDIWIPSAAYPLAAAAAAAPVEPKVEDELFGTVIDGKAIAEEIRLSIAEEVCRVREAIKQVPGLAVVLVGQRRDSQSYVRFKIKACQEVGIRSLTKQLPEDCSEDEVVDAISNFNEDPTVHGILVQLPLPQHMNEEKVLKAINLEKDVDGFHPLNIGNLALMDREPLFIPCAAKACIELLLRSNVELKGKHAAVIGRSNIVGLPTSLLLQRHHATVSIVHAFTDNPEEITRKADIVISAAGVANLVRGSWLKRGAIVIDVGTNPVDDPNAENGYYLVGDVCYEEASQVASAITPVPGGVGPVTIAMLLSNTLDAAKRLHGLS